MRRKRLARRLGTLLVLAGVLTVAYAAAVVLWRDPVTDVYTAYQQRELRRSLRDDTIVWQRIAQRQRSTRPGRSVAEQRADVRALAVRFARAHRGHDGAALGRMHIPRFGLATVVVEGTDYWRSLTRGPGRYPRTSYPGLGGTTAIAGHRTTFSAPFRHIDSLRRGDPITLEMPYGTFVYRVTRHRVVDDGDWSIVRRVGYDALVLSACHPLYSAAKRWVVFARLHTISPPGSDDRLPAV